MKRLLLPLMLLIHPSSAPQQVTTASSQAEVPYSVKVLVKEVEITFHATDARDYPVLDLKPEEIDVFDDGNGPGEIVKMEQVQSRPIRAAFIIDTSSSVMPLLAHTRQEAMEAATTLLAPTSDEGTVIAFDRSKHVVSGWTHDKKELVNKLALISAAPHNPIDGTSVYDTLFSTCLNDFEKGHLKNETTAILLFSDGEDTASKVTLQAAAEACRKSHTAVYAFSPEAVSGKLSTGSSTLRELTEQTGGFLFDDSKDESKQNLKRLALGLRSEYVLFYRPRNLRHDGAFHKIVLVGPKRVVGIYGTPGFYDLAH